jgi:ketosteroid isomerase-like protein
MGNLALAGAGVLLEVLVESGCDAVVLPRNENVDRRAACRPSKQVGSASRCATDVRQLIRDRLDDGGCPSDAGVRALMPMCGTYCGFSLDHASAWRWPVNPTRCQTHRRGCVRGDTLLMNKLNDFLASVLPRHADARRALSDGDAAPWLAMTSTQDPVTIFGAKVPVRQGRQEVDETLRWLAERWSDATVSSFDLVAADVSGDLAYAIRFEHIANSVVGVHVEPYTLRVTHIFRRENGEWKLAHRHADRVPDDQTKSLGSSPG